MQLVPGGPDIPNALIAEQQRGNVLFVCGAGVSMAAALPLFENLVKGVCGAGGSFVKSMSTWIKKRQAAEIAIANAAGRHIMTPGGVAPRLKRHFFSPLDMSQRAK